MTKLTLDIPMGITQTLEEQTILFIYKAQKRREKVYFFHLQ